jgi:hypothetical protein
MELIPTPDKEPLLTRAAIRIVTCLRVLGQQLSAADLNPHEGRLRGSQMPERFMDIPDYPPETDETA